MQEGHTSPPMATSAARDGRSGVTESHTGVAESHTHERSQYAAPPAAPVAVHAGAAMAACPGELYAAEPGSDVASEPAEDSIINQFLQCMRGPSS